MKKHEDYLALLQESTISHFRGEVSKDIFFDDDAYEAMPERITFQFARWKSKSLGNVDCLWDFDKKAGEVTVGLSTVFRKTKRKTEGSQHFAFPEISRENRGCLVLHSGNSRVSLSLRAGLGQNLTQN